MNNIVVISVHVHVRFFVSAYPDNYITVHSHAMKWHC